MGIAFPLPSQETRGGPQEVWLAAKVRRQQSVPAREAGAGLRGDRQLPRHPVHQPRDGGEVRRHGTGGAPVHRHAVPLGALQTTQHRSQGLHSAVLHQVCTTNLSDKEELNEISPNFHRRIQVADPEYKKAFNDELEAFKERIRARAKEKIKEQMEEMEEEERQQRLGPGGLDPVEVFETLPKVLQECFESQG